MSRLLSACALFLAVAGASAPAWADWRYDEEWRWRHRPPHYHPYPRDLMVVYPPPPPMWRPGPPPPRVVYVQPAPIQAVPVSPPYTDPLGRYCREYQSTVMVGGRPQPGYGTACLMPDGQWRVVE